MAALQGVNCLQTRAQKESLGSYSSRTSTWRRQYEKMERAELTENRSTLRKENFRRNAAFVGNLHDSRRQGNAVVRKLRVPVRVAVAAVAGRAFLGGRGALKLSFLRVFAWPGMIFWTSLGAMMGRFVFVYPVCERACTGSHGSARSSSP